MNYPSSLALVASLLLCACQTDPTLGGRQPATPPPAASVSTPASPPAWTLKVHDSSGSSGPVRLSTLSRLFIEASCLGASGVHGLRISVLGPGRTLYARLQGVLAAAPDGSGTLAQAMEIAGTPVEFYRMVGTWQFALEVDGAYTASADIEIRD